MKKILLFALCFVLGTAFVACGDKNDDGDNSTVVTRLSGILDMADLEGDGFTINLVYGSDNEEEILVWAPVSANGAFSLTLPTSLADRYLVPVSEAFTDMPDEVVENITTIGESTLMTLPANVTLELYRQDEYISEVVYVGGSLIEGKLKSIQGNLCYSAGNASVTGTGNVGTGGTSTSFGADIHLRKGWNWLFFVDEGRITSEGIVMTSNEITTKNQAYLTLEVDLTGGWD